MEKTSKRSLIALILAVVIFGTVGIFRRYTPIPSAVLALLRGAIGAGALAIIAGLRKNANAEKITGKPFWLLVITGCLIGLNWAALFESYNYTTVATATLCYYMQPTIVILLSPIFFKEKLTLKKGICAGVAVIGMLFVSGAFESWFSSSGAADSDANFNITGIILGLLAAALYSAVVIINKRLPGLDPYRKTIIQLTSAAVVMVPYLVISALASGQGSFAGNLGVALLGNSDWSKGILVFTPLVIVMIVIMGLVHTGGAYALYFGSIDGLHGQSVAILSYIDPVVSLILSALLLKEQMSIYGVIGAVLIIGAALVSEVDFRRAN